MSTNLKAIVIREGSILGAEEGQSKWTYRRPGPTGLASGLEPLWSELVQIWSENLVGPGKYFGRQIWSELLQCLVREFGRTRSIFWSANLVGTGTKFGRGIWSEPVNIVVGKFGRNLLNIWSANLVGTGQPFGRQI